jgi:hypothetical protein
MIEMKKCYSTYFGIELSKLSSIIIIMWMQFWADIYPMDEKPSGDEKVITVFCKVLLKVT